MEENRARYDLTIYKGEDYSKTSTWKIDKLPIDFTGWTISAQVRKSTNSEDLIAEFAFDIEPLLGKWTMSLTAKQTAAIAPGVYVWDLKMVDGSGTVKYTLYGKVIVTGRVTV